MSFALWCYRCYRFIPVEHVNIKYNIFRKRPCDYCYVKNNITTYLQVLDNRFPREISRKILDYLIVPNQN